MQMKRNRGILITLITISLIFLLIPLFVKPIIKNIINSKLTQTYRINDLRINNFSDFPNWKISVNQLKSEGQSDSIMAENISLIIFPIELLKDTVNIKTIKVHSLYVSSINQKDTARAQTNITNPSNKKQSKTLRFGNIEIEHLNFKKTNKSDKFKFLVANSKIQIQCLKNSYQINSEVEKLNISYDNLNYFTKSNFTFKTGLRINNLNSFQFEEGKTLINDELVNIKGDFEFKKHLALNIDYEHRPNSLKQLLENKSNLPSIYNYIVNGQVAIKGSIKGKFTKTSFPVINYEILVDSLKLVDQFSNENNIEIPMVKIIANMDHPSLDSMRFTINNTKVFTNNKEAFINLAISNAFQNPSISGDLKGEFDLGALNLIFPSNNFELHGSANIDLDLIGNYIDFKNSNYSNIISSGTISTSTIEIENKYWSQPLKVKKSQLQLINNQFIIHDFKSTYGQSDLTFSGELNNVLQSIFNQEAILADLNLTSNYLNLNQLFAKTRTPQQTQKSVPTTSVLKQTTQKKQDQFTFPDKLKLKINGNAQRILFDQMNITNFTGTISMSPKRLELEKCKAYLLDGQLSLTGAVSLTQEKAPYFKGNITLNKINFKDSFKQLRIVQNSFPLAQYTSGKISASLDLATSLNKNWQINNKTLASKGSITTHNLVLNNKNVLRPLAAVVKLNKINRLTVDDFSTNYQYENETLTLFPCSTKIANQAIKLNGTYQSSGEMDFLIDTKVDKEILSNKIQDMIRFIPGNERIKQIEIGAHISGDHKKPNVEIDYDKIRKQVMSQIKTSSPKELENAAKNLLKQLFK